MRPLTAVALACVLLLTSCTPRAVARTAHDLAGDLCREYYAERVGLSWDDAGRAFCATHEDLAPFLDLLLEQQRALDAGPVGARARSASSSEAAR